MAKNYVGFLNDHSQSMEDIAGPAKDDYNTNMQAIVNAANGEKLDTVVSVVAIGMQGRSVDREVTVSNPHVLAPKTHWPVSGGTPLWDGIADLINLHLALPDADKEDVSFLLMITTDGSEQHSITYNHSRLKELITKVQATGRWTITFRMPNSMLHNYAGREIRDLGIPEGNIQGWDTTDAGMAASTQVQTQAVTQYFKDRTAGKKSSGSFYADASNVNVAALKELNPKEFSLYVVPNADNGITTLDFILRHRSELLKGAVFYQLTKTEPKVGHLKEVLVRDQATGKVFSGREARDMIGMPHDRNARLHPGDHGKFDIFIQSEAANRKLVGGTGVIYWKAKGVPYTEEDRKNPRFFTQPKVDAAAAAPAPVQLPKVAPTNKPTKSPIPVTPVIVEFDKRDDMRQWCRDHGRSFKEVVDRKKTVCVGLAPGAKRYVITLKKPADAPKLRKSPTRKT